MAKGQMTMGRAAEICARLINGDTLGNIRREVRCSEATINRARGVLLRFGIGLPAPVASRLDPQHGARMQELFATTRHSNRAIARMVGTTLTTVNRHRQEFNKALVARGDELPRCGCGQYLHHPRTCPARVEERNARRGDALGNLPKARRDDARRWLLAGATYQEVARRLGATKQAVCTFSRALPAADREERERSRRNPSARKRAAALAERVSRPRSTDPRADPVYAQIMAAMPKGADPSLVDDAAGDAYLAYLERGRSAGDLKASARKALSRNIGRFASKWGDLSLDERRGPDGDWTLGEIIEDPRALEAFDAL